MKITEIHTHNATDALPFHLIVTDRCYDTPLDEIYEQLNKKHPAFTGHVLLDSAYRYGLLSDNQRFRQLLVVDGHVLDATPVANTDTVRAAADKLLRRTAFEQIKYASVLLPDEITHLLGGHRT